MAGLPWFSVATDFPDHPKTVRLCRQLRDRNAGMYVVRLLAYCAAYAPSGHLPTDMVEHAAGWVRQSGACLDALRDAGFIESEGEGWAVHGWGERNGAHVRKQAKDNARPRSDYRVPRENPARELGGNQPIPRAGDVEGEGEKTEKKKQLPSDALRAPVEGAPRRRCKATDTDPRVQALRSVWEEEYRAVYGKDPERSAADNRGYHRVIGTPPEEFRERARRGLVATGFLRCGTAAKLTGPEVWAQLAAPVAPNGATVMPIRRELK